MGIQYVCKFNSFCEDDLKKLIFYFKTRVLNLYSKYTINTRHFKYL